MFEGELAAKAALVALGDLVPMIVKIAQDETQKAEDRLHAVHILISLSQLGE